MRVIEPLIRFPATFAVKSHSVFPTMPNGGPRIAPVKEPSAANTNVPDPDMVSVKAPQPFIVGVYISDDVKEALGAPLAGITMVSDTENVSSQIHVALPPAVDGAPSVPVIVKFAVYVPGVMSRTFTVTWAEVVP